MKGDFLSDRQSMLKAIYGLEMTKKHILTSLIVDRMLELDYLAERFSDLSFSTDRQQSIIDYNIKNGIEHFVYLQNGERIECKKLMGLLDEYRKKRTVYSDEICLLKFIENNLETYEELCDLMKK